MFPQSLPRAAVRKVIHKERIRRELSMLQPEPEKASLRGLLFKNKLILKLIVILGILDMFVTFKRLLFNATLMFNNISSLFYFFGYLPFWTFTPKYIETQYRQSASVSRFFTATIAGIFVFQ